ncbi:DUF3800 domain-containing protein [Bacillus smithii]|uniref:DUF3800 domain-containing protein n=1 Tax=Bacillus smithii TaxID=1479 RepID=UPI002E2268DE|nr:DUF3800 domain-containing protein [Bacillus smithii]MED1419699.1 DUF3800 domain-containing protein [Bacillus smithii]MED1457042.1 DUF3800 domain-containing protein [Bacillus smithii]
MYMVYVDESGDTGTYNSPTKYFILSALIVHESNWIRFLDDLVDFRRKLRDTYHLKMREEIHAAEFFQSSKKYDHLKKHVKLQICKKAIEFQESLDYIQVMFVVIDKSAHQNEDIFDMAWKYLIQRIHNTLEHKNFDVIAKDIDQTWNESFILIPDKTDDKKLKQLVRRMRRYNPIPSRFGGGFRNLPLKYIVEDPYSKDSAESYIHQLVDVNAYFMKQKYDPTKYMKKKKAHNFINKFDKVLCTAISRTQDGVLSI